MSEYAYEHDWDCPKCGKTFRYTERIVISGYSGWRTTVHECGPRLCAYKLKPETEAKKRFWQETLTSGEECEG